MKKLIISIVFILIAAANAQAEPVIKINKGISGLLLGAGGGAIAGQAIGRDTESTLIGTAVGTLFGYVVGNEMDKGNGQTEQVRYRPAPLPAPAYYDQRNDYRYRYEPVDQRPYYTDNECREVEILGTMSGDPERLVTTACRTPQGWVLVDPPGRPAVHSQNQIDYWNQSDRGTYRPAQNNYTRHIRYQY